jgi:hexokinase
MPKLKITYAIFSRVCEVQLLGDHKFSLKQKKFKVTEELKTGRAEDLFGM